MWIKLCRVGSIALFRR
ncbi:Hypothetical protein SSCIU_00448 [Mammaliicoccus sciuri]|nr:Hypothetical protein SSCIU_00448 [Mammaliicoccus sciuri]